jgi:hypothetical protein
VESEGLTWAEPKISAKAPPYPEGIWRCRIGASDLVDSDRRYAERAQRWIERVFAVTPEHSPGYATLSHALEFYCPLLPGGNVVNDSSQKETLGAILSPERCMGLQKHWRSVDVDRFCQLLDEYIGLWEPIRPPVNFRDGAHVFEYISCYALALEEAINRDSYYVSFYRA